MRKFVGFMTMAVLTLAVALAAMGCGEEEAPAWQFGLTDDKIEYTQEGTNEWSPIITTKVKIVGGNDTVLFAGEVKAKTADMMASHFLKAVTTDKGLANTGIDTGFVETIGDYTNNAGEGIYWTFTVNGESPSLGCNQIQLREGDYMLWTYAKMAT